MPNGDVWQKIAGTWTLVGNIAACCGSTTGTSTGTAGTSLHSESLTDGQGNFIFAGGDIVTVVQIPEALPA